MNQWQHKLQAPDLGEASNDLCGRFKDVSANPGDFNSVADPGVS